LISPVEFDYSKLKKVSINANNIVINVKYNPIFSEQNIEDQLKDNPLKIVKNWASENITHFGNQNKFLVNILDASILKKEIENFSTNKYEEKTIYQYEVFILVEYELYNDDDYLLANTTVETSRSTTSKKYISINETEMIINDLLIKALRDFTNETNVMMKLYMSEYINN
tara:strand:+ start:1416 stop:1925 length:510 start_codon:yes stop_codon:yes gene_type:complete